ncbi:MAG: alpha/beta fold hydrolase [bacterium]|nr:alpha/beta fold hydrolase [bacterium]
MKRIIRTGIICVICAAGFYAYSCVRPTVSQEQITLRTMGSLFFGGTVTRLENGETFHGDHGYAQYFIPEKSRSLPLIMWHGMGQSGRSYETRPDGGEGFMAILPRHNWPIYIVDQPRRGRAGRTIAPPYDMQTVTTTARESGVWNAFRNGVWEAGGKPTLFPGTQIPSDPASIEQFFRQQTPATGEEQRREELAETMTALLERTGPAVLVTHSASGVLGWLTALAAPDGALKAIVAYEPGQTILPEGVKPLAVPYANAQANERMRPQIVPAGEFDKLTKFPILVVYGDNIATEPSEIFNVDVWRISSIRARQLVETINSRGGDARFVSLPEIGISGNTHAPFADLNNAEIAAHLEGFLKEKGLNGSESPHTGPKMKVLEEYTIPLER